MTKAMTTHDELYYRHRIPVRILHWINVICLSVLFMSGLNIFNAHPALNWGKSSYNGEPALFEIGARKEKLFLRAQSYLLLVFTVAAFLAINFGYGQVAIAHAAAPRWMIITAAIVLYSYLYWRQLTDVWLHESHELKLGSLLSFVATLLATLILWYELPSLGVAMAWCVACRPNRWAW